MNQVEDYIWGRIDETEYLRNIVASDSIDAEQFLPKLETIQQKLNTQLREGVKFLKKFLKNVLFRLRKIIHDY